MASSSRNVFKSPWHGEDGLVSSQWVCSTWGSFLPMYKSLSNIKTWLRLVIKLTELNYNQDINQEVTMFCVPQHFSNTVAHIRNDYIWFLLAPHGYLPFSAICRPNAVSFFIFLTSSDVLIWLPHCMVWSWLRWRNKMCFNQLRDFLDVTGCLTS